MNSWYDYPHYFDLAFQDETPAEVAFFQAAFERYAIGPVRRVYEPGCGSGRLVAAMTSLGFDAVGLDNNSAMLDYLRKRLDGQNEPTTLVLGDMTTHVCQPAVDAAFCTFNTFRHLTEPETAVAHLRSVADSLRPGGIYLLGFHCLPMDVDPDSIERWSVMNDGTRVSVTFRVIDFRRRERIERIRVSIKATKPNGEIERIRSEFKLRLYTPHQAKTLFAEVRDVLELIAIHDFDYDIHHRRKIDRDLIDALFVLRRR